MPALVEVAIRSFVGILLLIGIASIFMRKPVGETSQLEFGFIAIVSVIIAISSLQVTIPITSAIIALAIWVGGALLIMMLSMKSKAFRNILFKKGVPLMKDGKVLEDNMKKQHVTTDELLRKLRAKQVFQVADVEFAVLEGNGELNVLLKKEQQPITASMLNHQVAPIKEPETVIMDGKVLDEPLATRGLSRQWLETELEKMNANVENVVIAQVDEYGQLTVDLFDDQIQVPKPAELPLLEASIKKVQADMELYTLDTENPQAKQTYQWCAEQMKQILQSVSPFLKH